MLCVKAKTRQLLCDCSGALRTPTSQVCRAGGIEPHEVVCQRHFDKIRREDEKACSCPSSWGHSSKLHAHPVPARYYQILDQVGRSSASSYQPGTRWCNKYKKVQELASTGGKNHWGMLHYKKLSSLSYLLIQVFPNKQQLFFSTNICILLYI